MADPQVSQLLWELFSLTSKTAIVTGGTGGLGEEMTMALAGAGADIVSIQLPNDPNSPKLSSAVKKLGRKFIAFECNVKDSLTLRDTFAAIWAAGIVPDILLNCAGINRRGKVEDMKDEDIDDGSSLSEYHLRQHANRETRSSQSISRPHMLPRRRLAKSFCSWADRERSSISPLSFPLLQTSISPRMHVPKVASFR